MNIILAFVLFAAIAWFASPYAGVKIGSVVPDSPAEAAGLQEGESIYALDGKRYQFMLGETILEDLGSRPGETVTLTVVGTDGAQRDVEVTLRDAAAIAAKQARWGSRPRPAGSRSTGRASTRRTTRQRPVHRRAAPGRRARSDPRRARHARELGSIRPSCRRSGSGRHRRVSSGTSSGALARSSRCTSRPSCRRTWRS